MLSFTLILSSLLLQEKGSGITVLLLSFRRGGLGG
jgi:hypothetical protein